MRAARGLIIFTVCFLACHFSAYARLGSGRVLQAEEGSVADTLGSFFKDLTSKDADQERQLDDIFDGAKRLLMALASSKEKAEELGLELEKSYELLKQREGIIEKVKALTEAYDAGMTPEKKEMVKTKIENTIWELKDSVAESLKLLLEALGVKPEDAERVMNEDTHLARLFAQLHLFITSQLDREG